MQIGDEISYMHIGARQLAARGLHSKGKPAYVVKKKSIPSATEFIGKVWVEFSRAAQAAYGGTMEEVNASVASRLSGMDTGARAKQAGEREAKHRAAQARLAMLESIASGGSRYGKVEFSRVPVRESPYF